MIITTNIQTPERGESVITDRQIHNYRKKERENGAGLKSYRLSELRYISKTNKTLNITLIFEPFLDFFLICNNDFTLIASMEPSARSAAEPLEPSCFRYLQPTGTGILEIIHINNIICYTLNLTIIKKGFHSFYFVTFLITNVFFYDYSRLCENC